MHCNFRPPVLSRFTYYAKFEVAEPIVFAADTLLDAVTFAYVV